MNKAESVPSPEMFAKASTLVEALPYMQRYAGKSFVIKYGGHAMGDPAATQNFASDVTLLKAVGIHPIIVHGGGPQISAMLERVHLQSKFIDGLRVTTSETANITEMVLSGAINKDIVGWITRAGGRAVGISGKDSGLARAVPLQHTVEDPESHIKHLVDLGFVGEPASIDRHLLDIICEAGMIPVVAPLALGEDGETYNINADTMAGAIAQAMQAARLFMLTDTAGVLDKEGNLLTDLDAPRIESLRADGTVRGGMIPKLETCVAAVEGGVDAAVILDGRVRHALLLELFTTQGVGTLVRPHTELPAASKPKQAKK